MEKNLIDERAMEKNLIDERAKVKWHPITEDAKCWPEKEGRYLVTYYNCLGERAVCTDYYLNGFNDFAAIKKRDVTAWAELPEPYVRNKQ